MKISTQKMLYQRGFIPILVALIAGVIFVGAGVVATNSDLRNRIGGYFQKKSVSIGELRGKLTSEIRQCVIDKLGKAEAKKLLEETKQTKTISPQMMAQIRPCLGGVPIGPLPPILGTEKSSVTSSSGIALGIYQPAADPLSHGAAVDEYTKEVGEKPAFAWFSVKWENPNTGAYQQFDPRLLEQFRTRGILPGITWDASKGPALNKDQPDFSWTAIASGKHDTYITQTARAAAAYHYPFILRMLHEMDGSWYPWGYNVNGNTNPADYVIAWKHVVNIFRKEGAANVQFIWCPAAGVLTSNLIDKYGDILKQMYPGDDYVDWVGLDGYSNLADKSGRSLQDVFQPTYQFLKSFTHRPMMFFEVGAIENPNDNMAKANWITQGFLTTIPTVFSDVKAVAWFNGHSDTNPNKPNKQIVSWAVDTSQNSLNAWKQVVSSPLYQGTPVK